MIKKWIRNIILKEKASSERFVAYLRKKGIKVGEGVRFYSPSNTLIDITNPHLLSLGNYVRITHGVVILTHDYSWAVLKRFEDSGCDKGAIFGAEAPVRIGNNVFIGMNAIITRGVSIEDNVIIGAGSVVTKDCKTNGVYAGNPAKRIMSLAEYRAKRERLQFEEAKAIAIEYKKRFQKNPPIEIFREYFMLFCTIEEAKSIPAFCTQLKTSGNYEDSLLYMSANERMFGNYREFLKACFN